MKHLARTFVFSAALLLPIAAQAQEVLTVGIDRDASPFSSIDAASQEPVGLIPDIVAALAATAGLKFQIKPLAGGDLFDALASKSVDAVAANLVETQEAAGAADFSRPFDETRDVVVVRKGDPRLYQSEEEMKGMTFATEKGSFVIPALKGQQILVARVAGDSDIATTIERGQASGGIASREEIAAILAGNAHPRLRLADTYPAFGKIDGVFAIRKENAKLIATLNSALGKLDSDGTLAKLRAKWGVS